MLNKPDKPEKLPYTRHLDLDGLRDTIKVGVFKGDLTASDLDELVQYIEKIKQIRVLLENL